MSTFRVPERFLRDVWREQQFDKSILRTTDGKSIDIISPGFSNSDGGPDFINARIRIGETTFCGDVELHNDVKEWIEHHHEHDEHYNRTILHVVLTADEIAPPVKTQSGRPIPLLVLHPFLDDTLCRSLSHRMFTDGDTESRPIRCHDLNEGIPAETISSWIEKLGWERMELKVRRLEERLKQLIDEEKQSVREPYPRYYGSPDEIPLPHQSYSRKDFAARKPWEQLLYEGVMEALGFSKNRAPFLTLARSARLELLRQYDLADTQTMMAFLFGVAGLLPSTRTISDLESRIYVRVLRKRWKELRPSFTGTLLNAGDWLFFRLRPSNFPTARLATLCFLLPTLFGEQSMRVLIAAFKEYRSSLEDLNKKLRPLFSFEPDEFWSHHYHFGEATLASAVRLGLSRQRDILVNVLVPLVMLYARVFSDQEIRSHARQIITTLPPSQSNGLTRRMELDLIKGRMKINSALRQQGVIQLYRLYCSSLRCSECAVGRLVF